MAHRFVIVALLCVSGVACRSASGPPKPSSSISSLLCGLESPEPEEREKAIASVSRLREPRGEVVRYLAKRMQSRPFLGQWSAALAASDLGDEAVAPFVQLASPLDRDGNTGQVAIAALARIGSPALPGILKGLREGNPAQRLGVLWALREMSSGPEQAAPALVGMLGDRNALLADAARQAIIPLGSQAVPALLDALREEQAVHYASRALGRIGARNDADVAAIVELVGRRTGWFSGSRELASAIAWLGRDCVPAMTVALKHENMHVRILAANALGQVGSEAKASVPALLAALRAEEDTYAKTAIVGALGSLGARDQEVVRELLAMAREGNGALTIAAVGSLAALAPETPGLADIAAEVARAGDGRNWESAMRVLAVLGPRAKPAAPTLIARLRFQDNPWYTREPAAVALARIGARDNGIAEALVAALNKDDRSGIKLTAVEAIGSIGIGSPSEISALIAVLGYNHEGLPRLARAAAEALGRIARDRKSVAEELVESMHGKSTDHRAGATLALGEVGWKSEGIISGIAEQLRHAAPRVRAASVECLAKLAPDNAALRKEFPRLLSDPDRIVRVAAVQSVPSIHKDPEAAAAILAKAVQGDPSSEVRRAAAIGLGRLGPAAASAIPHLRWAMMDMDRSVRVAAAESLCRVDTTSRDGIRLLVQEMTRRDVKSRLRAIRSLGDLAELAQNEVGELEKAKRDPDRSVRAAVEAALEKIRASIGRGGGLGEDESAPEGPP